MGKCYYQNHHDLEEYNKAIDEDLLPVKRGVWLTDDDLIRKDAIMQLICHFSLDMKAFGQQHSLVFADYFKEEMGRLSQYITDNLIQIDGDTIDVQPGGRLLIRAICKVFDKYIPAEEIQKGYSRII